MKTTHRFFLLAVLASLFYLPSLKAQGKLTITYQAINTIAGYDHVSRLQVLVDGQEVGVSKEKIQSQKNKVTVKVPTGEHTVVCSLWAKYNNNWEERTLANNYSFDWRFEKKMALKSSNKLNLVFDVNKNSVLEK